MSKSRRDSDKRAFWQLAVDEQVRSELSVRAFCRREGLSEANFYAWRRKLSARVLAPGAPGAPAAPGVPGVPAAAAAPGSVAAAGALAQPRTPQPSSAPQQVTFVEVTAGHEPKQAVATADAALRVLLPCGAIVCVQAGFDRALLRQVVEVLS